MTREITMEKQEQEKRPNNNLAFKIVYQIEHNDDDEDHEDIEEDIALITKQF
jgi:hypothetical protein